MGEERVGEGRRESECVGLRESQGESGESQGESQGTGKLSQGQSDNHRVASWRAGESLILQGALAKSRRIQAARGVC